MGKLVIVESLTLDGVMQAPGGRDEDTRDGFSHGGWAAPYADQVLGEEMAKGMANPGPMLFGRRTFEQFASYWPTVSADNPYAAVLNQGKKYVVSRTLTEDPSWSNSELLRGEAVETVTRLKQDVENDIVILGSGELVRSLVAAGLIDVYTLLIHPLMLGSGRKLFDGGIVPTNLRLVRSVPTTTGVIIATYEPASA